MKRLLLLPLLALAGLSACSPALTQTASRAVVVMERDGADLIIPNAGEALDPHWGLVIDGSLDYQTDAQGQAWCPVRQVLPDRVRLSCDMPALVGDAQRRVVTAAGRVLAAQGFAYRKGSGAVPVPLVLP